MERLIREAKHEIPSLDQILKETWNQLGVEPARARNKFGEVLIEFDEKATTIFRKYEKRALRKLAELWIDAQREEIRKKMVKILAHSGWDKFVEKASQLFAEFGVLVQSMEKDIGNMRKARGGKTFEKVILNLLQFIGIGCEIPTGAAREELRRIDIVVPSVDIAMRTSDKAVFLTCKRTLRERWKQEVPQARLNERIYLITIDENLSVNKANEIHQQGLIAFVRDGLLND